MKITFFSQLPEDLQDYIEELHQDESLHFIEVPLTSYHLKIKEKYNFKRLIPTSIKSYILLVFMDI